MDSNFIRKNRIAEALELRNMRQSDLCELTGLKKSSVNGWIKQNWQPKQEALYKMAKVLGVSEMWLAGYDVPMERVIKKNDDDKTKHLVDLMMRLDDDQFLLIESMVNQLTDKNEG